MPILIEKNNLKVTAAISLILIITVLSFYPSLKNGFTNWDDDVLLTNNTLIRDLSRQSIQKMFSSYFYGLYHPLVLLSYSLEYHFFKLDPFIYHATNLVLHLINCLLVFWLIFLIGGNVWSSFIAAIFFAIHPIHVESVAWISERKDMLYAPFFLGALISYIIYRKSQKFNYYYFSLFLFILSVLAKPMAITLPFVLFICDYFLKTNWNKKNLAEKIPFLMISLVFGVIALHAKCLTGSVTEEPAAGFNNFLIASHRLLFYLLRTLLPIRFSYLYQHSLKNNNFLPVIFWLSPIIVAALIILTAFFGRCSRKIMFGSLFFLVTILPTIPLMNVGYSADRYTYIPLIGIFYLLGEGFTRLCNKIKRGKPFLFAALVIIIAALSILTWQRCKVWKDSVSLWSDALRNHPNHPALLLRRGNAYLERGDYLDAVSDYNQALSLSPNYVDAYYNRGVAYSQTGEFNSAISDYTRVISLNRSFLAAYINRGVAYSHKKEYDQSIIDYNAALKINPNYAEAYFFRGNSYRQKGDFDSSVSDYSRAIELNPDYAEAYYTRSVSYFLKKEYDKAWGDIQKCQKLGYYVNPDFLYLLQEYYLN